MIKNLRAAFTSFPYCVATYVTLLGFGWLVFTGGYKPVKSPVPLSVVADPISSAYFHAQSIDGNVSLIAPTGSMRPLLEGGDYVVLKRVPYAEIKEGDVLSYYATWQSATAPAVIHRAVQKDAYGWIMSGDSVSTTESFARVTEHNYLGKLIAIYRKSK